MKKRLRIYGLLGLLALFGFSLFSAGLPFLQAEEIPHLALEPIDRGDVIREIVLIVIFFVLAVLGFIKGLYFLLRQPSLRKGVIMGIGMVLLVALFGILTMMIVNELWFLGYDGEDALFLLAYLCTLIALFIAPIVLLVLHKKDSRRPEEQKKIFTRSTLMRKILDIFIPLLCLVVFLFALVVFYLFVLDKIREIDRQFAALLLPLIFLASALTLVYLGVLIGIFRGYITQKKRTKIFTKSDMWITALFVLLIPLTLISLSAICYLFTLFAFFAFWH